MTAIIRPWQWLTNHQLTAARMDQDHDAILLAQDPPGCIVRRVATQGINISSFTDISFDTETADNDGMFTATSTTVTIQHDGYYTILGAVKWASNATGTRAHGVSINGAVVDDLSSQYPALAGNPRYTFGGSIPLVTGDTVKLNVWQDGANPLNCQARMSVIRAFGPGV